MTEIQIRSPRNNTELASFREICRQVGVPTLLGEMDGTSTKGLMALADETLIGGLIYAVCNRTQPVTADLDALAIHPNYQRRGTGKKLIDTLKTMLREEGVVEVKTIPIGFSKQFYLACGFKPEFDEEPFYMTVTLH